MASRSSRVDKIFSAVSFEGSIVAVMEYWQCPPIQNFEGVRYTKKPNTQISRYAFFSPASLNLYLPFSIAHMEIARELLI
jgi:hypothetical protein